MRFKKRRIFYIGDYLRSKDDTLIKKKKTTTVESHCFSDRFEELFNTNNLCQYLCQAAMRWSSVRLDSLVIASSCIIALFVIWFKNEISPAFAGLAMAYATQMTGVFQYTVRLMSETEMRFISVERISHYLRVNMYISLYN